MKLKVFVFLFVCLFSSQSFAQRVHCQKPGNDDEENRTNARRYFTTGTALAKGGDHRAAMEHFACVLRLVPFSLAARYQYARALDAMEQYKRARQSYEIILNDVTEDAERLKPEIRKRLEEIKGLADKPLPKDEEEETEEARAELKRQQEHIREQENKLKNMQAELQKSLKDLEKKGSGNLEAERKALMEEFKRREAAQLKDLEQRLQRLQELEKQAGITPPPPQYKYVPTTLRKIGTGVMAGGLLLGVAAIGFGSYSYMEQSKFATTTSDDKKSWPSNEQPPGKPLYWKDSSSKSLYDTVDSLNNLTIGLSVVTGITLAIGATLYFVGGADKVLIEGSVRPQPTTRSWQILPQLVPGNAGFVLQTSW